MTSIANRSEQSRSEQQGQAPWLVFRAGQRLCAVPLAEVAETMRPLPIEAVPGAPSGVRGAAVIRGSPVPVIDLGVLFGSCAREPTRFVCIKVENRTVALAVDSVVGINTYSAGECGALPPLLRDAATDVIAGIEARDAALVFFLSAARIVPPDFSARSEVRQRVAAGAP